MRSRSAKKTQWDPLSKFKGWRRRGGGEESERERQIRRLVKGIWSHLLTQLARDRCSISVYNCYYYSPASILYILIQIGVLFPISSLTTSHKIKNSNFCDVLSLAQSPYISDVNILHYEVLKTLILLNKSLFILSCSPDLYIFRERFWLKHNTKKHMIYKHVAQ